MPTVAEVLKQNGFTDQQIAGLDPTMITAFGGVLDGADRALADAKTQREAAELAQRSNIDFYENRIAPSLVQWDEEKNRLENERAQVAAEAAFYRTQAEEARKSGFIASQAPTFTPPQPQPRDNGGRYVAGVPGATPGSPTFNVQEFAAKAGDALGMIADIEWEHQKLFGQPLPVSPSELIRQADQQRLDPRAYAARAFNFEGRRAEMQKAEQEKHDQQIRAAAVEETNRSWAERVGSNPDLRQAQRSPEMVSISRAVRSGQKPDPILMSENERRAATREMIREDMQAQQ